MKNEEVSGFLKPHRVKHVAMEATVSIAPIYRKLVEEGYDVFVSHPKETRSIARARIKTDKTSSRALADLLRLGSLPLSYMPSKEIVGLRERVRRRAFLVRQRAKLKTKIKSSLTYMGVKPPEGHGLYTRKGVEWLRGLGLEPVDCYLRLMSPLSREVLHLNKDLRAMARDDPEVRLLMTIPGIGYYIGLLIKAEVGDVNRFTSGDHLASYAGLVPSTRSGGGVTIHGRITKEGFSWLRWTMVEATHSHLRIDTPVTRLYHRVAERRGSPTAKVAAARKLVTVCYSVLKHGKPYHNPLQPITLRP